MPTANIIGSGPNGLAAAITLSQAGVQVTVYEAASRIGGACSSAEITLPGFLHDLGSSAYPMGVASPFLGSLPLKQYGFQWVHPQIPLAHPLDDGTAVTLTPTLEGMRDQLSPADFKAWQRLLGPLVENWNTLIPEILGPIVHIPRHPLTLARFGLSAILPAAALATSLFQHERTRALFAGNAAHSVMPLTAPLSASIALVLAAAGHTTGWPVAAGGAQSLSNALAQHLRTLGGTISLNSPVTALADLPQADLTLCDTSAQTLARIARERLTPAYLAALAAFKPGPGVFKIDYALSSPIPWRAPACRLAATVHVGGTLAEIVAAEDASFQGQHAEKPFLLLVQPTVADPTRAPAGCHTAWAYCHVPNGSTIDRTQAIESQIERFAPGFRDCILARRTQTTAQLEAWNPNLTGGDLSGGAMTPRQLTFRPTIREYGTSDPTLFLCSSSTPPGGGVHGMSGHLAAKRALRSLTQ